MVNVSHERSHDLVEVWDLRCEGAPTPAAEASLSGDERDRAARFRYARDRHAFVTARSGLRRLLGELLSESPADLVFEYGPQGKPSLRGRPLEFSVSHAADRVLIAVARGRRVGVDVEAMGRRVSEREISARFFSRREVEALEDLLPEDRVAGFYRCWTRKEAFLKADGRGLSLPLADFAVSVEAHRAELLWTAWDPHEVARWTLRSLDVGPGFAAALAVEGSGWTLGLHRSHT